MINHPCIQSSGFKSAGKPQTDLCSQKCHHTISKEKQYIRSCHQNTAQSCRFHITDLIRHRPRRNLHKKDCDQRRCHHKIRLHRIQPLAVQKQNKRRSCDPGIKLKQTVQKKKGTSDFFASDGLCFLSSLLFHTPSHLF